MAQTWQFLRASLISRKVLPVFHILSPTAFILLYLFLSSTIFPFFFPFFFFHMSVTRAALGEFRVRARVAGWMEAADGGGGYFL